MSSAPFRVAVAQISCEHPSIERLLEKHIERIEEARSLGASTVVFPELSLSKCADGTPVLGACKEQDAAMEVLASYSKDLGIVVGFAEQQGNALYNSANVFRMGAVATTHRKVNLVRYSPWDEGKKFEQGQNITTFVRDHSCQVGVLICNDFWNPGLVHAVASQGTEVLYVLANSVHGGIDGGLANKLVWTDMIELYARLYGLYIVFANSVGSDEIGEYFGGSRIVDPFGRTLTKAPLGEPDLIHAEIDLSAVQAARAEHPLMRDNPLKIIRNEFNRISAKRF